MKCEGHLEHVPETKYQMVNLLFLKINTHYDD